MHVCSSVETGIRTSFITKTCYLSSKSKRYTLSNRNRTDMSKWYCELHILFVAGWTTDVSNAPVSFKKTPVHVIFANMATTPTIDYQREEEEEGERKHCCSSLLKLNSVSVYTTASGDCRSTFELSPSSVNYSFLCRSRKDADTKQITRHSATARVRRTRISAPRARRHKLPTPSSQRQ